MAETSAHFLHRQGSTGTNQRGTLLVNRKGRPRPPNPFRDKISGNNFHRCIQSALSISQIKDHPPAVWPRGTRIKKKNYSVRISVRRFEIRLFSARLGVKSHNTFHAANTSCAIVPLRTRSCTNFLFSRWTGIPYFVKAFTE